MYFFCESDFNIALCAKIILAKKLLFKISFLILIIWLTIGWQKKSVVFGIKYDIG